MDCQVAQAPSQSVTCMEVDSTLQPEHSVSAVNKTRNWRTIASITSVALGALACLVGAILVSAVVFVSGALLLGTGTALKLTAPKPSSTVAKVDEMIELVPFTTPGDTQIPTEFPVPPHYNTVIRPTIDNVDA
jgi:hypothetical protein